MVVLESSSNIGLDNAGSRFQFGGRKGKSGKEALLIVKLIQDHAKWCKRNVVIKFMDIEKFFDTMNFKRALIIAYKNGLKGRLWSIYKEINNKKTCIYTRNPVGHVYKN